jgi:hypothetical protein
MTFAEQLKGQRQTRCMSHNVKTVAAKQAA